MTNSYAIAEVSKATYDEIRAILLDAGYQQAIHRDGETETLDMHGIALRAKTAQPLPFDPPVSPNRDEFLRLVGELERIHGIPHNDRTLVHLRIAAHSWAGDEFRIADDERRVLRERLLSIEQQIDGVREHVRLEAAGLNEVFDSLHTTITTDPRDFSIDKRDAWLYAILVGWDEVLADVAAKHRWDAETVERLKRLHAIVEGITEG